MKADSNNASIKKTALIDAAAFFLSFFIGQLLLCHWYPTSITKNIVISALAAAFMYVRGRKDWFD